MGSTSAEDARSLCSNCLKPPLRVTLLFAVWLAGCNTCFTFTSNPPTGTINIIASDPKPTCALTKANGAVRLVLLTVPICGSCSESARIQHIFVSIRGIDVHSSAMAGADSPDWQDLAPQFAKQPLEVDLVRGAAEPLAMELLRESVVLPAGVYRQLRVRFASNPLATKDPLPEKNPCGNASFNCVVTADGAVHSLPFDSASPELRIPSERTVGGFLLVFPDIDSDLVIEMRPVWSWVYSVEGDLRFLPVLNGNAKVERIAFNELDTATGGVISGPPR